MTKGEMVHIGLTESGDTEDCDWAAIIPLSCEHGIFLGSRWDSKYLGGGVFYSVESMTKLRDALTDALEAIAE